MRSSARLATARASRGIAAAGKAARMPCRAPAPLLTAWAPSSQEVRFGLAGRLAAGAARTAAT